MHHRLREVADALVAERIFVDPQRFIGTFHGTFRRTTLKGKTLLDVGCGVGTLALGAVAAGATMAVGLEPEVDGSTEGVMQTGRRLVENLGLNGVSLRRVGIDDYDFLEGPFDVVVMYNVINHLDESACSSLRNSVEARAKYAEKLSRIRGHMTENGHLIIADCARNNLFGDIGIRNPVAKTIEWNKHQNPSVWSEVLRSAGFSSVEYWWNPLHLLRWVQPVAATRLCAYLTNSHFILRAIK